MNLMHYANGASARPIQFQFEVPFNDARFGVNLAGAEFGGHELPGVYGLHYIYPDAKVLDYYHAKSRTLIRLPFHWERMQRELHAPLDEAELSRLLKVLSLAHDRQMDVIVDVHNYGRYKFQDESTPCIIGCERVPYTAFADLWKKLAVELKNQPAVYAYGLMNEPHDMDDDERWPRAAQAAIDAIREVDHKMTILASGDHWSSSRYWRENPNEFLAERLHDPADNLVFEAHCYFDRDNSGAYKHTYDDEDASADCGIEYVRPFVEWCEQKKVRGFVGEYGVPDNDALWLVTMDRFLAYLQEHNISSAYWAGGPWWGKYTLSIEPGDARVFDDISVLPDRPQMLVLSQYTG